MNYLAAELLGNNCKLHHPPLALPLKGREYSKEHRSKAVGYQTLRGQWIWKTKYKKISILDSFFHFLDSALLFYFLLSTFYFLNQRLPLNCGSMRTEWMYMLVKRLPVEAVLFAEKAVNAVEGRIIFPEDMLIVKEIRDGNSSINFGLKTSPWGSGKDYFFRHYSGRIQRGKQSPFSITFKAKKTGTAAISISNAKALQNDGEGTETRLRSEMWQWKSKREIAVAGRKKLRILFSPEPFALSIAREPVYFNEEWFVAFATSDKDSGVSRYEIKEYRFSLFAVLFHLGESQRVRTFFPIKHWRVISLFALLMVRVTFGWRKSLPQTHSCGMN